MARDNRSGLWGAQERARKALVHANKVRERTKRALRVAEAPRDTIAMPKPWRLTGRSGQPPPSGATPGWTATPRTLSTSASAFDQRGGVLRNEPADHPPRGPTA